MSDSLDTTGRREMRRHDLMNAIARRYLSYGMTGSDFIAELGMAEDTGEMYEDESIMSLATDRREVFVSQVRLVTMVMEKGLLSTVVTEQTENEFLANDFRM